MGAQQNIAVAQTLLARIASGQEPEAVAALFDENLVFEIQGDNGALPWVGHQTGRQAIVDFIGGLRALTEPIAFEVEDILASENRAAIVGALRTGINITGKITASQFAIILTIENNAVKRFQMLEDSFDLSKAARA